MRFSPWNRSDFNTILWKVSQIECLLLVLEFQRKELKHFSQFLQPTFSAFSNNDDGGPEIKVIPFFGMVRSQGEEKSNW